jgi:hypothetical protein
LKESGLENFSSSSVLNTKNLQKKKKKEEDKHKTFAKHSKLFLLLCHIKTLLNPKIKEYPHNT